MPAFVNYSFTKINCNLLQATVTSDNFENSSKERVADLQHVLCSPIADWPDYWNKYDSWPTSIYSFVSEAWLALRTLPEFVQTIYIAETGQPEHFNLLSYYTLRHLIDLTKTNLKGKKSRIQSLCLKAHHLLTAIYLIGYDIGSCLCFDLLLCETSGTILGCVTIPLNFDKKKAVQLLRNNASVCSRLSSLFLSNELWKCFGIPQNFLRELLAWLRAFFQFIRRGPLANSEFELLLSKILDVPCSHISEAYACLNSLVAKEELRTAIAAEFYEWLCLFVLNTVNAATKTTGSKFKVFRIIDYGSCNVLDTKESDELGEELAKIIDKNFISQQTKLPQFAKVPQRVCSTFNWLSVHFTKNDYVVFGAEIPLYIYSKLKDIEGSYYSLPLCAVELQAFGVAAVKSLEWILHAKDIKCTDSEVIFLKTVWVRYNLGLSWVKSLSYINYPAKSIAADSGTTGCISSSQDSLTDSSLPGFPTADLQHESKARRRWVWCTFLVTGCIPDCVVKRCANGKDVDANLAWREKLALFLLIVLSCLVLLFYVVGMGLVLCPSQKVLSPKELSHQDSVYAYGRFYDFPKLKRLHVKSGGQKWAESYQFDLNKGRDVSDLFYPERFASKYCPGYSLPPGWSPVKRNRTYPFDDGMYAHDLSDALGVLQSQYTLGYVALSMDYIEEELWVNQQRELLIIQGNVYDVTEYMNFTASKQFLGMQSDKLLTARKSSWADDDVSFTELYNRNSAEATKLLHCLNGLFIIGRLDYRDSWKCKTSNYILLSTSAFLAAIIGFKFLAAMQCGTSKQPELQNRYVLIQIPCYTEGTLQLEKTMRSCAISNYGSHANKLLFITCDGMVIGQGNAAPTPELVLNILGVCESARDCAPLLIESLGLDLNKLNRTQIYSGMYSVGGLSVPYVAVIKVGLPLEKHRPGNRGKRDSQVLLLNFLRRVHLNEPLSPAELEICLQMQKVLRIAPTSFEFLLMVDADTEVSQDSLNRMVAAMVHDSRVMGLCGDTLLANEKDSWVTMIQVYEYFISHHMAKAFESLFGSVTCLPGCFCMYRIRSPASDTLYVVNPCVLEEYSIDRVDTLHMKNLLSLGEDRYLTTLMLKNFPSKRLHFLADAKCTTVAPHEWRVLLSQRRRWINSTVHNLFELLFLQNLCGFCCFSMRFVVFLELFSTFVQPAVVVYVIYLCVSVYIDPKSLPLLSILLIASIYLFQVLLFIFKVEWQHVGWMCVYLLAMPIFSFYLPLYSFWHFDDFTWGDTRKLNKRSKGASLLQLAGMPSIDYTEFLYKSHKGQIGIPLQTWSDYCQMAESSPTLYSPACSVSEIRTGKKTDRMLVEGEKAIDWEVVYLHIKNYLYSCKDINMLSALRVIESLTITYKFDFSIYSERVQLIIESILNI